MFGRGRRRIIDQTTLKLGERSSLILRENPPPYLKNMFGVQGGC